MLSLRSFDSLASSYCVLLETASIGPLETCRQLHPKFVNKVVNIRNAAKRVQPFNSGKLWSHVRVQNYRYTNSFCSGENYQPSSEFFKIAGGLGFSRNVTSLSKKSFECIFGNSKLTPAQQTKLLKRKAHGGEYVDNASNLPNNENDKLDNDKLVEDMALSFSKSSSRTGQTAMINRRSLLIAVMAASVFNSSRVLAEVSATDDVSPLKVAEDVVEGDVAVAEDVVEGDVAVAEDVVEGDVADVTDGSSILNDILVEEQPKGVLTSFGFDGLGHQGDDYAASRVVALAQSGEGAVLFLGVEGYELPMRMVVGAAEAMAVLTAAQERKSRRPVTHEAWGLTLEAVGWKVTRVAITSIDEDVYYCRVILGDTSPSEQLPLSVLRSVDVRPSDGIALALRCKAPLFVSRQVAESVLLKGQGKKSKGGGELKVDPLDRPGLQAHANGRDGLLVQRKIGFQVVPESLIEFSSDDSNWDSTLFSTLA